MYLRPKCNTGNYKPPRGKIHRTIFNINHPMFLDPLPRVIKINKSDLIKLKSFCTTKKTKSKTKRLPMEWEKIFANVVTDKGLYSEIYKQLMQLNIKTTKQ